MMESSRGGSDDKTALHGDKSRKLGVSYGAMVENLTEEQQKVVLEEGLSGNYDINQLITLRIFGMYKGTVLTSKVLWMETGATTALYLIVFAVLYQFRWRGFSQLVGSEGAIRAFIGMLFSFIAFLLAFYTALNLNRWWQMRGAVQNIQEASKKLLFMVTTGVTQDPVVLNTINRYARASLFFVFAASNETDEDKKDSDGSKRIKTPRERAVEIGLLKKDEEENLSKCCGHMVFVQAETLWAWLGTVIEQLNSKGLTKGPPHYCALMAAVEQGRAGISEIQQYLETPIPLGYVHLLCFMVKLHNILLSVLMGMTTVMLAGGEKGFQGVGVFRTAFRATFMPFMLNALLILNSEVTDPFGSDEGDFDFTSFDVNMLMTSQSYAKATQFLPDSLSSRDIKPIKASTSA